MKRCRSRMHENHVFRSFECNEPMYYRYGPDGVRVTVKYNVIHTFLAPPRGGSSQKQSLGMLLRKANHSPKSSSQMRRVGLRKSLMKRMQKF